jgi:hypothetical protein
MSNAAHALSVVSGAIAANPMREIMSANPAIVAWYSERKNFS